MTRGLFISIEGPDGSGKSTQIKKIKEYLNAKGYETVLTREPGGTVISEKIREVILDKSHTEMASMTEALLYAASRAQHVAEVIKPSLEDGKIVICDRFVDSSIAYQGCGRNLGEAVEIINRFAVDGCMPDITFLFMLPPSEGKKRKKEDEQDRIEKETLDFHNRVYQSYLNLEKRFPHRIQRNDATKTIEEVSAQIIMCIEAVLEKETR